MVLNMKKLALFGLLATSLALTLGSLGVANRVNKKVTEAEAGTINNGQLYVQMTEGDTLKVGDIVLLTSYRNVLHSLEANPAYAYGTAIPGINNDGSKCYFENTTACPMLVVQGTQTGTFAFQSLRNPALETDSTWRKRTYGYFLAHNDRYDEGDWHIQVKNALCFRSANTDTTSWTVSFDGDSAVIKSYGDTGTGSLRFTYAYAAHFGYMDTWGTDPVSLLRKVDLTNTPAPPKLTFDIITDQTQGTVENNGLLNLSGLELEINLDGMNFRSEYNNEPDYYEVSRATTDGSSSPQAIQIKWCGLSYRVFAYVVGEAPTVAYYNRVTSLKHDYRGTYLLAAVDSGTMKDYIIRTTIGSVKDDSDYEYYQTTEIRKVDYEEQRLSINYNSFTLSEFEYTITRENYLGNSYLFLHDTATNKRLYNVGGLPNLTNVISLDMSLTIDQNMYLCIGNDKLVYDRTRGLFTITENPDSDCVRVSLFQKEVDLTEEINEFIVGFDLLTSGGCDVTGENAPSITSAQWDEQATAFNALSLDGQGYLADITYTHNAEEPCSAADIVDRYDYIVSKYSFNEFMNRREANTYQDNWNNSQTTSELLHDYQRVNVVVIITIVMVASVSVLSFILVLKKRKQTY